MQRSWLTTAVLIANFAFAPAGVGQRPDKLSQDCSSYESIPLPAEAEAVPAPKIFPACASYRSYRGIGRPVNYSQARACAWQERLAQQADLEQNQKEPTAWFVGGSLILADIYVNGAGVKRNIPLALRFACEAEKRMAEVAVVDIVKLDDSHPAAKPFEFCDYGMTTFTMTFCDGYESRVGDDRQNRYYNSLKSSMKPVQQAAFEKLLAAQKAYVHEHAFEVDQGGTIRGMRTIGSEDILNDLFHTELVHFERKQWPVLTSNEVSMADALLQREYKKKIDELGAQTKEQIDDGAVSAVNLAKVETAWNSYLDAWVAFAKLRYPAEVDSIRAKITLDRYRLLKTINSYNS